MYLKKAFILMFGWAISTWVAAQPVGDSDAGKAKSAPCMACHGDTGNSPIPLYPKIAGLQVKYLIKQLHDLKNVNSGRQDPVMSPMAASLSNQDILDLSAFYAVQTRTVGETPQAFVELGQKIYLGGDLKKGVPACAACHGPAGLGNDPAGYPALSGQHPDYTIKQLKQFKAGERKNDPSGMMQTIAAKMTDQEIEAVAHFVQGLYKGESQ